MSVGDAKIAILDFLRDSPGRPAATIGELLDKLNIELGPEDIGRLVQELRRNDRVLHDSADGTYRYRPQVEGVLSRADLLEFLTKQTRGVLVTELSDAYIGVLDDIEDLKRAGDIICIRNISSSESAVLFARREPVWVDVAAVVTATPKERFLRSDVDLRSDLFRGEVLRLRRADASRAPLGTYRISTAHTTTGEDHERGSATVAETGGDFSAAHTEEHVPERGGTHALEFTADKIPLNRAFEALGGDPSPVRATITRVGVEGALRKLWRESVIRPKIESPIENPVPTTKTELEEWVREKSFAKVLPRRKTELVVRSKFERIRRKTRNVTNVLDAVGLEGLAGTELGEKLVHENIKNEMAKLMRQHKRPRDDDAAGGGGGGGGGR